MEEAATCPRAGILGSGTEPRVSVVLPTCDRPALLREAISSIEAQSIPDWEIIVVDDASAPPVDALEWAHLGPRLRVIRNPSSCGGAASKAVGARVSSGEFIAYLDDDDLFHPEYLEQAVNALDRQQGVDVLFMEVEWFGNSADTYSRGHLESLSRVLAIAKPKKREHAVLVFDETILDALVHTIPMCFQRPVLRRSALSRIGEHKPDCLLWDCEWALRAALLAPCALLNERLYRQRVDGQGYHSQPDRELAQMRSAAEMMVGLLDNPPPGMSSHARAAIRSGAGRNLFHLAYYLSHHGALGASLGSWLKSQWIDPDLRRMKFLLGAAYRGLGDALPRRRTQSR